MVAGDPFQRRKASYGVFLEQETKGQCDETSQVGGSFDACCVLRY